jgi:hypothetical protein
MQTHLRQGAPRLRMTSVGPRHLRGSQLSRDTGALLAFAAALARDLADRDSREGSRDPSRAAHQAGQPHALPDPTRSDARPLRARAGCGLPRIRGVVPRRHGGLHTSAMRPGSPVELPGGSLSSSRRGPWGLVGRALRMNVLPDLAIEGWGEASRACHGEGYDLRPPSGFRRAVSTRVR